MTRVRMSGTMQSRVLIIVLGVASCVQVAHALSEWWTPPNASCPTFDSEESCQAYCRAATERCGGSTECVWKTGDKRPEC